MYNRCMTDWKKLHTLYCDFMPQKIDRFLKTKSMQRIRIVDMNCGMQYSSFPQFVSISPYSRYTHSIGVASIVYAFTRDFRQCLSGLFHDISTPVFSHVVDFMAGDYEHQEYTEKSTTLFLEQDEELMEGLHACSISLEDVADYHRYSIADNDSPQLSADRLEYTLGNMLNYGFSTFSQVSRLYKDISICTNEYGQLELAFQHRESARLFFDCMMQCAHVYVADEDRYGMEYLSRMLQGMLKRQTITWEDIYSTESHILQCIQRDPAACEQFRTFQGYTHIQKSRSPLNGGLKVKAKKRFIDPYVVSEGRLSKLDEEVAKQIEKFESIDFEYYMTGC